MIDPRSAHLLDARALLPLLPGLDQSDLHEIRCSFFRFLDTRAGRQATTWQEGWNDWTGAAAGRPGLITFTPPRCKECSGRGITTRNPGRNLARTGHPNVCGECRGSRRASQVRQRALHATEPTTTHDES